MGHGGVSMKPRLANLAAFLLFVSAGAFIVYYVYGNSLYWASYISGQALSVMLLCQGAAFLLRRFLVERRTATGFLLASVSLLAINASDISYAYESYEAKRLLALAEDAAQIHLTARQNPSNRVIQFTDAVLRKGEDTQARLAKIVEGIEPSALAQEPQPASATRTNLENYRSLLSEAETRARAAFAEYSAVLSEEREAVLSAHKTITQNEDLLRAALRGIDKRHASSREFLSRFFEARAGVYATYGRVYEFLVAQHGRFQVKDGKFIFIDQPTADRWNALVADYTRATQRLEAVSKQIEEADRVQADNWRRTLTN